MQEANAYHQRKPYLVAQDGGGNGGGQSELSSAHTSSANFAHQPAVVRGPTGVHFELTSAPPSSASASPNIQTTNLSSLASAPSTAEPNSSPSPHQSPSRVHRSRSNADVIAGSPLLTHLTVGGTTTPHRGSFNRSLQLSSSPPRGGLGERAPSPAPRNQTPPPTAGTNPRFLSTLTLPPPTSPPAPQLTRSVSALQPGSSPSLTAANRAFTPTLDLDTLMAMGSPDYHTLPRGSPTGSLGARSSSAVSSASIPIVQRRASRSDLRANQPMHMNGAFGSPKFGAAPAAAGLPDTGSPPPSFYRSQSALGFSLSSREALRASGSGLGMPGATAGNTDGPNLGVYGANHNLAPGPAGANLNRYSASTSLPNLSFFQQAQAQAAQQLHQQQSSHNLLQLQPSATQQASSFARSSFSTQVSPAFSSPQQQQSLVPQQQLSSSHGAAAPSGASRFRERMGLGTSPVVSPMNGPRRYSFSGGPAPSLALTAPPLPCGGGSPHLHSLRESEDSPRGAGTSASLLQLDLSSPGSSASSSLPTSPAGVGTGYLPYPDPAAAAGSPGKSRQLLRTGTTLNRRFSLTSASQLTNAVSNAHSSMFAQQGGAIPGSSPVGAGASVERDLLRGSGVLDQMTLGTSPKAFLIHLPTRAAPGFHYPASPAMEGRASGHGLPQLPAVAPSSLSSSTPLPAPGSSPGHLNSTSSGGPGSPASMSFPSSLSSDHPAHFSSHSSASSSLVSSAASSTSHSKQPSSIPSPLAPLTSMSMRRSATEGDVNALTGSGQHHHHHAAEGSPTASSGLGRPTSLGAPTSAATAAAAAVHTHGSMPLSVHALKLRKSFSHHADPAAAAVSLPPEVEA